MKLRFEVDQAACLRAGIDCPHSIVAVEVNPAKLPQEERDLLADRLQGIDLYPLALDFGAREGDKGEIEVVEGPCRRLDTATGRIVANAPSFDALMAAVRGNENWIRSEEKKEKKKKA